MRLDLSAIESGIAGPNSVLTAGATVAVQQTQELIDVQPEVALLPVLLRRYLWNVGNGAAVEAAAIQSGGRLRRLPDVELPPPEVQFANVSKGGCIAAAVWPVGSIESYLPDAESEVQCIRATANFYRCPWFDSVAVRRATRGRQVGRQIEHAQLRLLFSYPVSQVGRRKCWLGHGSFV